MNQNRLVSIAIAIMVILVVASIYILFGSPLKKAITPPPNAVQNQPTFPQQNTKRVMTDANGNPLGDIAVLSSIPGYQLTLLDKNDLLNEVRKWDVFGLTYDNKYGISTIPVSKVILEITNKPQPLFASHRNNQLAYSSNIAISEGQIRETVYVGPQVLDDISVPDPVFQTYVLHNLAYVSVTDIKSAIRTDAMFKTFFEDSNKGSKLYFKITKD